MTCRRHPRGMTLLEVLLAVAISVVFVLAVYQSVVMHYAQSDAGRERAGRAQLLRGVLGQLQQDVRTVFTGWQPVSRDAAGSGDATNEPIVEEDSSESEASSTPSSSGSASLSEYEVPAGGVLGYTDAITFIVRRSPSRLNFDPNFVAAPTDNPQGDLRLVRYWFGAPGVEGDGRTGLVRQELDYVPDVTAGDDPTTGARTEILAEEIRHLAIRYFDGYSWVEEWGQSQEQSPQAIEFVIGMVPRGMPISEEMAPEELEYRRVVFSAADVAPPEALDESAASSSTPASSTETSSSGSTESRP